MTTLLDTTELRRRGLHHEADAAESIEDSGSRSPPPTMPRAIVINDDPSPRRSRSTAPVSNASPTHAATSSAAGDAAAVAGTASPSMSSSLGSSTGGGGGGGGDSDSGSGSGSGSADSHTTVDAPEALSSRADISTPAATHTAHASKQSYDIDPENPLSGLRSGSLRDSLEREAFRNADAVAQDSAIVVRARTFSERVESVGHEPPPIDISRTAQEARIAALNGQVPGWVRGNPEFDPTLLKAAEPMHVQASIPEPARASLQARTSPPNLASGIDRER